MDAFFIILLAVVAIPLLLLMGLIGLVILWVYGQAIKAIWYGIKGKPIDF